MLCCVVFFLLACFKFIMETGNSSNAKFYGSKKGAVIHFLTFSNLSMISYVWETETRILESVSCLLNAVLSLSEEFPAFLSESDRALSC